MRWLFGLFIAAIVIALVGNTLTFLGHALFDSYRPPMESTQLGFRGTGMVHIYNPRATEELVAANRVPFSVPYAGGEGVKASEAYENVQVLGDVGTGEFTRIMVSITDWVAPKEGCAACHDLADFAKDTLYTKVVARRMLQMTRHINATWTPHVRRTGVTCYTCHRGQLVPPNIWFGNPGPGGAGGLAQMPAGQNRPAATAGGSALPLDPFTPFLHGDMSIRVQGTAALAGDNRHSIKQAEWTYALMMHFSQALGVNCNFCHNTRSLLSWESSPPQRVQAWHGIRMVRDLNNAHLDPLRAILPPTRLGPVLGDAPKVNCATCHNGAFKPLLGVSMAQGFPELTGAAAR